MNIFKKPELLTLQHHLCFLIKLSIKQPLIAFSTLIGRQCIQFGSSNLYHFEGSVVQLVEWSFPSYI